MVPLLKLTPDFQGIYKNFEKNLKKTKGDYFLKTFPKKDLSHISLSFLYSYFALKNKNENALKKLEERVKEYEGKEYEGEEKERVRKISESIRLKVFDISFFLLGRKATKSLFEKENIDYLSVAREMKIPFDYYGILGSNLRETKKEVDERAKEIIEDYPEKKKRYLPHLSSLLAYGTQYKEEVNELLKIEDLWDFKFSHLKDLNFLLDKIKDLKIEIGEVKIEEDPIDIFIKNLDEHLKAENFEQVKKRITETKEENRELAKDLIEKTGQVIDSLKERKIPNEKDISFVLFHKEILKDLGFSLTYDSLKGLYNKLKTKEKKEIFGASVKILKTPEEHLSAINIEPSCMRAKGKYPRSAFVITQGPILVIGAEDNFERIFGRSLLIPIKKEEGWSFEFKGTYGMGREYIKDFIKEIEEKIGEGKIEEGLIEGELPKSKKLKSTEKLDFWRDGMPVGGGLVTLKEFKE